MYAELHLHTCYSFLEGASRPEELAMRAARLGYRALAITDHDGLYGAMEFAQVCADLDIQPIVGVELALRHGLYAADVEMVHLTLLAENSRGYANLCRLITEAHRSSVGSPPSLSHRGERVDAPSHSSPHRGKGVERGVKLDPAFLVGHTEGIIALSGCRQGEVARLVDEGRSDEADEAARRLADLFGPDNTFIELQQNLVRGDTRRIARLVELARRLGLRVVATGNVHYHDRSRHRLQDAMVAIRHRTTLEASHRIRRPNSEFFLRSPQEMAALFVDHPEAIASTALIAERCKDFNLAAPGALRYEFPTPDPRPPDGGDGLAPHSSDDEVLAAYCWARFYDRYPPDQTDPETFERARQQLTTELDLVARHRLAGFFLLYRDIQELAAEVAREVRGAGTVRGGSGLPPGRGRGSSVSSIICYLVGLSHVDPVKNRLFFRRFLNEELQSLPDIDLDFPRDIRERLILRVYERYGHDHAALVCSFATYRLRSAVRDLGKVLGLPQAAIDKLARLSEGGRARSIREEMARLPEFQGQAEGPLWAHLVDLAEQIDGFPRHVGQHVGGMVISARPLIDLVPVQPAAMEGRFICQWDKDSCEDARFMKIDFLALGMLSLVEECLELIWQTRGEKVDLGSISYDDPSVYDAICRGDTIGLFQIESRAQVQMLTRTQPRSLDDLAVQVAIVRPGPIVGGAVNPYVRRREMVRRDPSYRPKADHPMLDDLLRDTLGVVLYQDQVLEVAMTMGGFSPGQADRFRRAMSRRRSREAMEAFRESFIRGARERGVSQRDAEMVFNKLCGFSEYGFPKSHAYAFAVLAYQSAWLRHYYPVEYYAALLNNQPMGFYAPHLIVGDARRHGVPVLRASINRSGVRYTPVVDGHGDGRSGYILLGLTSVKGLREDMARAIVAEREAHGPYRSLSDLVRRTGLSRYEAEKLIAVGAMSEFGLSRRELLWQLGLLLPAASRGGGADVRTRRPIMEGLALPIDQDMVTLPDMDEWERMAADYRLLGLSPSYHPMALWRRTAAGRHSDLLTAAQMRNVRDGARVRTAGLVACRQRPGTAKGFVFLLLEDETGMTNVVVRPDLYEAERSVIRGEAYLYVEGVAQIRSGSFNLLAQRIVPLAQATGATGGQSRSRTREAAPCPTQVAERPSAPAAVALPAPASHDFR